MQIHAQVARPAAPPAPRKVSEGPVGGSPLETPPSADIQRFLQTARQDAGAVRHLKPPALPIHDALIPDGESHWTSKPDSVLALLCDKWPWTVTKTDDQLRMFCPGKDGQDKQIVLQSNPDGTTTARIEFDGQWLPDVPGHLEQTPTGVVFRGQNGERIAMDRTEDGFQLEFAGLDGYPGKMSELDGMTIDFTRS